MNTGYKKIVDPRLARFVPKDFEHVEKHPLTRKTLSTVTRPAPVSVGVNWYSAFDNPVKKGTSWWAGLDPKNLGYIRGGHCVCMPDDPTKDLLSWYTFYNQGNEGACVGFGTSRMMSLLNRKRFNAWWSWDMAKSVDDWSDTNPGDSEGTSVRAAMDIYRLRGHVPWSNTMDILTWQQRDQLAPLPAEGIVSNKWATNVDDLFLVLQNDNYKKKGAIPFLNSWGKDYPHIVWVPCETWDRLLKEDGEFTMVIDK